MRDAPALDESGRSGASPDEEYVVLLVRLRDASKVVDQLWRASVADGSLEMAMNLGEASHDIHRALIALENCSVHS
jgi:hypothetical protein